jgi:hypothetical protein
MLRTQNAQLFAFIPENFQNIYPAVLSVEKSSLFREKRALQLVSHWLIDMLNSRRKGRSYRELLDQEIEC